MSPALAVAFAAAILTLAFVNGANDNFKGVATLHGSGRASYRTALTWASLTTLAGAVAALLLAAGLVARFTGKGLVPDALVGTPTFALAVAIGAAVTLLLATRLGFPVSTTHALMGGLVGAGAAADAGAVHLPALGRTFVLPLVASPVAALALTALVYGAGTWLRRRSGLRAESCVCLEASPAVAPIPLAPAAPLAPAPAVVRVVAHLEGCKATGGRVGVTARRALDSLHFLSAGAVGFARGLNDTPKIVALLAAAPLVSRSGDLALVAVAMIAGGLAARRVAETMSRGITTMNDGQGFAANLVTSSLVMAASFASLPVSTTHVSVGALFGIGAASGQAKRGAIVSILLAWLVTAPLGAAIAFLAQRLLSR